MRCRLAGDLLAHYGRHVPLEELRRVCGVSRDGSTAATVLKAARRYGMVAKGFQMDLAGLATRDLPAVMFWRFNTSWCWKGSAARSSSTIRPPVPVR